MWYHANVVVVHVMRSNTWFGMTANAVLSRKIPIFFREICAKPSVAKGTGWRKTWHSGVFSQQKLEQKQSRPGYTIECQTESKWIKSSIPILARGQSQREVALGSKTSPKLQQPGCRGRWCSAIAQGFQFHVFLAGQCVRNPVPAHWHDYRATVNIPLKQSQNTKWETSRRIHHEF